MRNYDKRKDFIENYTNAQKELFKYFNCDEQFFVKRMSEFTWAIKNDGDFYFLNYWNKDGKRNDAVVVKKNGHPMIFKTQKHTMVIGIDCVKIGFIFDNEGKTDEIV
jgi:hypothetical protein